PPSAWRTVTLDVPHRKYKTPRVYEQKACPRQRTFRQFFITDLGHDEPTILLTNDKRATAGELFTPSTHRMLIENALSDAVRFFHIDALSSSVGMKVDFDMALLVLASGLYRLMANRMRGYHDAQARQIFRDLIDMTADVAITEREVTVRFHRRAHLPIIVDSDLFKKSTPLSLVGRAPPALHRITRKIWPVCQDNSVSWKARLAVEIRASLIDADTSSDFRKRGRCRHASVSFSCAFCWGPLGRENDPPGFEY